MKSRKTRPSMVGVTPMLMPLWRTADEWAQKYDLVPFTGSCHSCGSSRVTSIPFYSKDGLRGLVAPLCPCGDPSKMYCVVRDPRYGDLLDPQS